MPFDLLVHLLKNAGQDLTNESLKQGQWNDGNRVGREALNQHFRTLYELGISRDVYIERNGSTTRFITVPQIVDRARDVSQWPVGEAPRYLVKLPTVDPTLIGREEQLAILDRAWSESATNFVQIVASGGTGKTALMDRWFRRHLGEAIIFAWSFYSQGTSEDRQTSSEPFFDEILNWFDLKVGHPSPYAKAEAVARRMRNERVMLILDGVEPLQTSVGILRDPPLKALLQELSTANKGTVFCTSRFRLDIPDDEPRAISIDLDNLTPECGAAYLRHLRVRGIAEELQQASVEYGNHALALTLLGTYLVEFCDSDIRSRFEIQELLVEEGSHGPHARRVMAAYERIFAGLPEARILRALGYFDRPAEPAAFKLVMPELRDREYRAALRRLGNARLILTANPGEPIDCHPLVREHFAAMERQADLDSYRRGHGGLYEHYSMLAPRRPTSLDSMAPLFYAVYHGCRAGRHVECCNLYRDRILQGDAVYLTRSLGAFGTDISLLVNFFEVPWTVPVGCLGPSDQSWIISRAASTLRAFGRLADAVIPMRTGAEMAADQKDWKSAGMQFGNLSQLFLTLGSIQEAIATGRQSVDFAEKSCDWRERVERRTKLAEALHSHGEYIEATALFEEAERIQIENDPEHPILYSVPGFRYCELLLDLRKNDEVIYRASRNLPIAEARQRLLDIGLHHASLGRAYSVGSDEAIFHLNEAVNYLRGTYVFMLPIGLLARGTLSDLEEVFRVASRSGMRLYLADYHLASARVAHSHADPRTAEMHLKAADALIRETTYGRRLSHLEVLRKLTTP
jgi:tetratricopeptide (TPR) repeat protein